MTKQDTTRTDGDGTGSSSSPQLCIGGCGQPIPAKRLAASPNARICVQCLEARGDVSPTRRMDEYTPQGDRVETYFEPSDHLAKQIEHYRDHLNNTVPAPYFYGVAVGDDSELIREGNSVIDVARPLRDEFEDIDGSEIPILTGYSRGETLGKAA